MKVLITGATGFIGQNLIRLLHFKGYEIHCIVRSNSDISSITVKVNFFKYDENIDSLIVFFQKEEFDGVIHLASLFLTSHTKDDISALISSNIKFGTELLQSCKESNVKWFINTGTFWQHYQNETYNPVNLYAATKQAFEDIAKYFTQTSGLIFTTLNLNDTFGANDTRNKIFTIWSEIAKTGEILQMSHGEQIMDICYIEDVINAYETLINYIESNPDDVKNKNFAIHSNERMSLKQLSKVFENAVNISLNIEWGKRNYREREVMLPWSDTLPLPGWKQKYSLREGIQKTIGIIK